MEWTTRDNRPAWMTTGKGVATREGGEDRDSQIHTNAETDSTNSGGIRQLVATESETDTDRDQGPGPMTFWRPPAWPAMPKQSRRGLLKNKKTQGAKGNYSLWWKACPPSPPSHKRDLLSVLLKRPWRIFEIKCKGNQTSQGLKSNCRSVFH